MVCKCSEGLPPRHGRVRPPIYPPPLKLNYQGVENGLTMRFQPTFSVSAAVASDCCSRCLIGFTVRFLPTLYPMTVPMVQGVDYSLTVLFVLRTFHGVYLSLTVPFSTLYYFHFDSDI